MKQPEEAARDVEKSFNKEKNNSFKENNNNSDACMRKRNINLFLKKEKKYNYVNFKIKG